MPMCANAGGQFHGSLVADIHAHDNMTALTLEDDRTFVFGHSTDSSMDKPPVITPDGVVQIMAYSGDEHTIALDDRGCVWVQGDNTYGQCGVEIEEYVLPAQCLDGHFFGDADVSFVGAGGNHSVVVTSTGAVYAFGLNSSRQCGAVGTECREPALVDALFSADVQVVSAACGADFTVLLTNQGHVYSAGDNSNHQCGVGDQSSSASLTASLMFASPQVRRPSNFLSPLGGGPSKLRSPQIQTMSGQRRSLSQTAPTVVPAFTRVDGLPEGKAVKVVCGAGHTVCLCDDGVIYVWGSDTSGQINFEADETLLSAYNDIPLIWENKDDMGLVKPPPEPVVESESEAEVSDKDDDDDDEEENDDDDEEEEVSGYRKALSKPTRRGKAPRRSKLPEKKVKSTTKTQSFKMGEKDAALAAKMERIKKLAKQLAKLDRQKLAELKTYNIPPPYVHEVVQSFLITLGSNPKKVKSWETCRVMIGSSMVIQAAKFNPDKKPDKSWLKIAVNLIANFDDDKVEEESMIALILMTWVRGVLTDEFEEWETRRSVKNLRARK
ncbi:Regulator of chromosome condensation (RCC1) repeat [Carpediemonas membranifera]|uniref:Regulator of chromosome condensation (RCC1) repeat n=1 Tax=Carpediemonas membranifera TaxID=201153 RepID=A0A8J6AYX3_9EUKA|nr:Regulator of chromosome condensation (RCC1) repeat [Carpediemonas membranifera]|eukprot:KAG9397438.1 Regulator of chromosome condensation (RCC1) repeat [Carpediemonas membranifera]